MTKRRIHVKLLTRRIELITNAALLLCGYYNKSKIKSFSHNGADEKYLSSIGLIKKIPTGFEQDETLLTREEESSLFQALHYVRYKITNLPNVDTRYTNIWKSIRSRLVCANIGLIRQVIKSMNAHGEAEELQSNGFVCLLRSIDKFDPWRDNGRGGTMRFCTYAYPSILRGIYTRHRASEIHICQPSECNNQQCDVEHCTPKSENDSQIHSLLEALNCRILDEQELDLIKWRFGLRNESGEVQKKKTLREVGNLRSLSEERIRQLGNKAISKLAKFLKNDPEFKDLFYQPVRA